MTAPQTRRAKCRARTWACCGWPRPARVDDGKSTLVGRLLHDTKSRARRPARRRRARRAPTRGGGRGRPRAAHRRPARRARAGHHHRRRLPLLLHRDAARSSSPTPPGTSSTRGTWSPAPRPPSSRSCSSTPARGRRADPPARRRRRAAAGPHVVLAVNKMDLVGFDEAAFDADRRRVPRAARRRSASPTSRRCRCRRWRATTSSTARSARPGTRAHPAGAPRDDRDRTRPPSSVCGSPCSTSSAAPEHPDYRGYAGRVAGGAVRIGDEVVVLPSGARTRYRGGSTRSDGPLEVGARGPQSVDAAARRRCRRRPRRPARTRRRRAAADPVLEGTVCWLARRQRPGRAPLPAQARRTRTTPRPTVEAGDVLDTGVGTTVCGPRPGSALNALARVSGPHGGPGRAGRRTRRTAGPARSCCRRRGTTGHDRAL